MRFQRAVAVALGMPAMLRGGLAIGGFFRSDTLPANVPTGLWNVLLNLNEGISIGVAVGISFLLYALWVGRKSRVDALWLKCSLVGLLVVKVIILIGLRPYYSGEDGLGFVVLSMFEIIIGVLAGLFLCLPRGRHD